MRKYFNIIRKKYYWCGNKHRGYGFREWRFFWWRSMPMHVHLRILRIYYFPYRENSHPENSDLENFHQSNFPLVNPPWNIPTHVFKDSRPSFLIFFSLLLPLSLILLKRLLCNSMFQKWLGLYVCENLSKGSVKWKKIINEMGGDILVRIFCVAIFRREVFLGGVWIFRVGIFRAGIPLRGIFLKPFFSYNVSILTFQKIITRYNKSFNKKIYTLNS